MTKPFLGLRVRFDAKWIPEPNSGCWLWVASLASSGYGQINANGSPRTAHTVAYELYRGPIPKGLIVRHHCDVPSCVNPDHLALGTYADNVQDMQKRNRSNYRCGTAVHTAKLTEANVRAIRADQRGMRAIAAAYNVAYATVRTVKARVSWKHVADG